jgi:hypothetical protein
MMHGSMNIKKRRHASMPQAGFEHAIPASERPPTYALGYGYIRARTDTTQQSGQTLDKEVEIKNITVYVSGNTETIRLVCYFRRLSGVSV